MGSTRRAAVGWSGSCTALRVLEGANARASDFYQRPRQMVAARHRQGVPEGELPVSDALMMADFARGTRPFKGCQQYRSSGKSLMSSSTNAIDTAMASCCSVCRRLGSR